jgi:hypothetical protein
MKKTLAVLASMAVLTTAALVFAGVPKGKETLKIDLIAGKKGAVEFPHAKHAAEFKKAGGAAIECKDCHHTAKSEKDAKSCSECHVKPGEAAKKIDGKEAPVIATMKGDKADTKSVIFHKTCKDGCHKEMKAEGKKITACKTCHKK